MILRIAILVLAAGAAGGAAWLATQGRQEQPAPVEASAPEQIQTTEVLVAAVDVPIGEVLSPDKVRWEEWPEANGNEQFITRAARPGAIVQLTGSFVNSAFVAGEPIREGRLMATNINLLSNKLASGKRAASVRISAENTAGGFILPGDRVDVIHTVTIVEPSSTTPSNESQIIIPNVRVLAIDQTAVQSPEGTVIGETATLELSPSQAERIMAAEASGILSLALRAVADHAEAEQVMPDRIRTVRVYRATESTTVTLR